MAWCSRSGARENVGITPWRKVFSPPSSESSSTLEHGQRVPVCTEPSSTTSRVCTTLEGFTARSTTAAQPSGSPSTATSTVRRHNQHKQPVRQSGSSPECGQVNGTHRMRRLRTLSHALLFRWRNGGYRPEGNRTHQGL